MLCLLVLQKEYLAMSELRNLNVELLRTSLHEGVVFNG